MNFTPDINTKYSLLTHISENDMSILKEVFDDAEANRFLPELYELLDAPDGLQKFVSTFDLYAQNGEGYLWGIKHNGVLVGFIAVMDLSDVPAIFYAMHPNHRSRGYMKDALHGVIDYLGNTKTIRNITTEVYKDNNESIILLRLLGFCICNEDNNKVYLSKNI